MNGKLKALFLLATLGAGAALAWRSKPVQDWRANRAAEEQKQDQAAWKRGEDAMAAMAAMKASPINVPDSWRGLKTGYYEGAITSGKGFRVCLANVFSGKNHTDVYFDRCGDEQKEINPQDLKPVRFSLPDRLRYYESSYFTMTEWISSDRSLDCVASVNKGEYFVSCNDKPGRSDERIGEIALPDGFEKDRPGVYEITVAANGSFRDCIESVGMFQVPVLSCASERRPKATLEDVTPRRVAALDAVTGFTFGNYDMTVPVGKEKRPCIAVFALGKVTLSGCK